MSFVFLPLALQTVLLFNADHHNYWPQFFALLFCTWAIPSAFAMANLPVGTVNSLIAWMVSDGYQKKIKYLSRIHVEEHELHSRFVEDPAEFDTEPPAFEEADRSKIRFQNRRDLAE